MEISTLLNFTLTNSVTYLLMPSAKHKLTMDKATA